MAKDIPVAIKECEEELDKHGLEYIMKNYSFAEYYYLLGTSAAPSSGYYAPSTIKASGLVPGKIYHLAIWNSYVTGNLWFEPVLPVRADAKGNVKFPGVQGDGMLYAIVELENGREKVAGQPFVFDGSSYRVFEGEKKTKKLNLSQPAFWQKAPAPVHNIDYSKNAPLQEGASYGLFRLENGIWKLEARKIAGKGGTVEFSMQENSFCMVARLAERKGGIVSEKNLKPGENCTVWGLDAGSWKLVKTVKADENGTALLDVSSANISTYAISPESYLPKPFEAMPDGSLKFWKQ